MRGAITGLVVQLISGVGKLRVCGAEPHGFRVWARAFAEQRRVSFRAGQVQNAVGVFNSAFPIFSSIATFATLVYVQQSSGASGGAGGLSTGDFIAFSAAFGLFLAAMQSLSEASLSLLKAVPIWERLVAHSHDASRRSTTRRRRRPSSAARSRSRTSGSGTARTRPYILKDLTLKIAPGQFVAFVGGSGSGKSTLMRLMLGFEKPEKGSIYYDGQDLATLDLRLVRQQLGVVLQDSRVLPADIYRNIVGTSSRSVDDAWAAAEKAGLAEDVRAMPMQMHTYVSEGGGGFSGGQKQRLMIARAVVGAPKILFLDEATSALDNRTQAIVTESMNKMHATRIVIAHRLSTIVNADVICYLEGGAVKESGHARGAHEEGRPLLRARATADGVSGEVRSPGRSRGTPARGGGRGGRPRGASLVRHAAPPGGRPSPRRPRRDYPDEPFVAAWEEYARGRRGAGRGGGPRLPTPAAALSRPRGRLGDGGVPRGDAARGAAPPDAGGPAFVDPGGVTLTLHPTLAGRLPVLVAKERADFETLVRVFSARNEPVPVPPSMGACLVKGFNNWDRVARFRRGVGGGAPGRRLGGRTAFPSSSPKKAALRGPLHDPERRTLQRRPGAGRGLRARTSGTPSRCRSGATTSARITRRSGPRARRASTSSTRSWPTTSASFARSGASGAISRVSSSGSSAIPPTGRAPGSRTTAGRPPLSEGALSVLKTVCHDALLGLEEFDAAFPDGGAGGAGPPQGDARSRRDAALRDGRRRRGRRGFGWRAASVPASTKRTPSRRPRSSIWAPGSTATRSRGRHPSWARSPRARASPSRPVADLAIAIDELVSNVAKYGTRPGAPPTVSIAFHVRPGALEVEIADSGPPFDPLSADTPDVSGALDERPIGGLGLHLVRKLADESRYERKDGLNVVRLVRRF